jgi:hypothetical protein
VTAGEAEVGVALTQAVISISDINAKEAPNRAEIRRQLYESVIT